jgi:signal transduction histidine kinase
MLSESANDSGRIEAAEQELQMFCYLVSHDLAASFRHVTEFSRLLVGDETGYAEHVLTASVKCQLMLEQLLIYSRLQRKTLEKVDVDASALLRLPILQLTSQVRAAGGDVVVGPLGEVHADSELLLAAVKHLLDNALKFRRPGVAPRISIRAAHDPWFWRIQVSDNGPGIEPAYREKAFQMFQRLGGEAQPGIGVGLAICRRIARRHGGEVRCLDTPEGCCVELALPRDAQLGANRIPNGELT